MNPPTLNPIFRALALFYDIIIIVVLCMLISAIAVSLNSGEMLANSVIIYINKLAYVVINATYFITSWVLGGQTIGMRAWKIKVVSMKNTDEVKPIQGLCKYLLGVLSLLLLGLPWLSAFLRADKQTPYDRLSQTRVYRVIP